MLQDGGNSEGISFLDNYQHPKLRMPLLSLLRPTCKHTVCQMATQISYLKGQALLSPTFQLHAHVAIIPCRI